jgi:hypothetical protein
MLQLQQVKRFIKPLTRAQAIFNVAEGFHVIRLTCHPSSRLILHDFHVILSPPLAETSGDEPLRQDESFRHVTLNPRRTLLATHRLAA